MAEVLATMVVGPLVSMVKEKASSYLLDQYGVMDGMEAQHKLLKRKLPAVLDVITDAEEQAAKNREGAKAWLQDVREVAYKANDVLDEFKYEALRRKAKADGHYKEFGMDIIKLFPSHNRFVFRYKMANKLRIILQEIDVLIAEMNTFRFKFKPQPPMSMKWRQTDPNISDNSLIGIASDSRAKEKDEIVTKLCGQRENMDLTVLPIVGMGGMGKTTLAQLVYDDPDIQKHFQLRLWVCVSENFDVDSLFEIIVKEAKKNGSQINGDSALEKFKSAVSGMRYLLVLDDVWNRDKHKWKKLKSYIHHGGTGSSVLTTTRDENIAQLMGTIEAYKIKDLDSSIIEQIIKAGAFSSQAQRPDDELLLQMVGKVAKRCSGSPLAATALGSVLRTKNTVQEWEAVLSRNTICDEENGILPILKLSYNCLPPHMRQCFAFCAMFPKDYTFSVERLIQLWMANSFIPEQPGVCLEVTGGQIFNELAQRSFFQVEQNRFNRQTSCKIHDLMHDVAQDSMAKECATVDTDLSQSEDFPYSARHLFLSVHIPENVLNVSPEKGSPTIQTLICDDGSIIEDVHHLSKYCRSLRALKTQQVSLLQPKYLHHLRYLDLSGSNIKALPEDITMAYHLQTLKLHSCRRLEQLPKAMKYMTGLRHLYTTGCPSLKGMPPDLGCLTSLQMLSCFVAGVSSGCSNIGELEGLDLGGPLVLRQLENVRGKDDAEGANLEDKKRLEKLILIWTDDHDNEADKEVLEGLRPHDGLKSMGMVSYGGSAIPTWMLELHGMVELKLFGCQNLKKLPALWQLPALQFLVLHNLENLQCLFSGGAPSKFQKLESMTLSKMPKFETWWDMNVVQGEEPIFPKVESLKIEECDSLAALPEVSVIKQSSGDREDTMCRSMFPALREMKLSLRKFHGWGAAVDGTPGDQVAFPCLEKLEIWHCSDQLTSFPEAPKLSKLELNYCTQQASLQAASRYITSLSSMEVHKTSTHVVEEKPMEVVVRGHESPLEVLELNGRCDLFFSHSSALALWKCFGQLATLEIHDCETLVYWPEEVFQGLVSLRTLEILSCSNLTGRTEGASDDQPAAPEPAASDEQPAAPEQSRPSPPRLEFLGICHCESLVQIPNIPASLRTLRIVSCDNLMSIIFGQQEDCTRLVSGEEDVVEPADMSSSLIDAGSSTSDATLSSSADNHFCFFPCLESLDINLCDGLTEVANLPLSVKTLKVWRCENLVSLSGEVPSLEQLNIDTCECLESLPSGAQAYSSLRVLEIKKCPGIRQLPPNLQHRLDYLDEEVLDRHLQEIETPECDSEPESISDGASTKHQGLMSKLVPFRLRNTMECFRSRSED